MAWPRATQPVDPPEPEVAGLEVVDGAFLTPVEHGPLRGIGTPNAYLRGAVYDAEGRLVVRSQKLGGVNSNPWVTADPARTRVRPQADLLPGRWLYGGHWAEHFGHFLTETVTTLWPGRAEAAGPAGRVEGLLFHQYLRQAPRRPAWSTRLLELAGYGDLPVEVVGHGRGQARRVEELAVPSRAVVSNGWALPQAALVWRRMAAPFAGRGGPPRLYLSRTRFNARAQQDAPGRPARSDPERDAALDRLFEAAGFTVVYPEELAVDAQVELAANAAVLAGGSGSALHLSAFAPSGAAVLEVGDRRNTQGAVPLQRVVDAVAGHRHRFVSVVEGLDGVRRALDELG